MDDKEAIPVLEGLLATGKLSEEESQAVRTAVSALSLMVHTSESYIKKLKDKKGRNSVE